MNEPSRFDQLGELIQEEIEPGLAADDHRAHRIRFVESASRVQRAPLWRRNWALAFAGAAALAVLALLLGPWPASGDGEALRFEVGVEGTPGQVGKYIAPVGSQSLPVQFSDGSTLRVHPSSWVRVAETSEHGASVALEAGHIEMSVPHREDAAWTVVAGPYRVRVTGTEFTVRWDPDTAHAQVRVKEGAVVVTGPMLEGGAEVRGGETFSSRSTVRVEPSPSADVSEDEGLDAGSAEPTGEGAAVVEPGTVAPPEPAVPAKEESEAEEPGADAGGVESSPSWSELAAGGNYEQIVKQAEARGVESVLISGSAAELQALSQAARFTGRGGLGHRCLMKLRDRYPQSSQAHAAAFVLGRMADQGGQSAAALQWYDTYLAESPGGSLVAEAYGRRMVLLHRSGSNAEAKTAAQTYLKLFPKGGYAPAAKDILGL